MEMTHMDALRIRLANERGYLARAKTGEERALRRIWIAQLEKEIAAEAKFVINDISDDELLAELTQ